MSDFKTRLETEKTELNEKFIKLNQFIETDNFNKIDDVQKSLLKVQAKSMETYLKCLIERLSYL